MSFGLVTDLPILRVWLVKWFRFVFWRNNFVYSSPCFFAVMFILFRKISVMSFYIAFIGAEDSDKFCWFGIHRCLYQVDPS